MTEEIRLGGLRFVTSNVSAEDQAAVEAVLDAVIAEESAQEHAVTSSGQTPWQKSQRATREEIGARLNFGVDFT